VNGRPEKRGNKIILEMINGFYNNHKVSSVIEFICSNKIHVSIVNMNVYYILSKIYDPLRYDIYIILKK